MFNQCFLDGFKSFLKTNIFKSDDIMLEETELGGSSINFICRADNVFYFIKLLQKNQKHRLERIGDILGVLAKVPGFHTAPVIDVDGKTCFDYGDYTGIILAYIAGKKIKSHELSADLLKKIMESYRLFRNAPFDNPTLIRPFVSAQDIYCEIEKKLEKHESGKLSAGQSKILNCVHRFNRLTLHSANTPPGYQKTIHGDANLNNIILDKDNNIYFLDFETLRLGYPVEDVMFLILSAILPHSIFFLPKRQLASLISYLKNNENFTKDELLYGVCRYFQFLMLRRTGAPKFLTSLRKDWLFLQYLKKYYPIKNLIEAIYAG